MKINGVFVTRETPNCKESPLNLVVLRPLNPVDSRTLLNLTHNLVNVTAYKRNALNDDLPYEANCMTAVRYLLKGVKLHLPRVWVGDLPAALQHQEWRVLSLSRNKLKSGDLLFVHYDNKITHVALAIETNKIFHCAFKRGAVIDSRMDFLKQYPSLFRSTHDLTNKRDLRPYTFKL